MSMSFVTSEMPLEKEQWKKLGIILSISNKMCNFAAKMLFTESTNYLEMLFAESTKKE